MGDDIDEEGFPRFGVMMPQLSENPLRLRRRFQSTNQVSEDHENGETTLQKVIVLRRLQRNQKKKPPADTPLWSYTATHERLTLHLSLVALRNPMPIFTHPRATRGRCDSSNLNEDDNKRSIFRVPSEKPSAESLTKEYQGQKIILVSIWKEYYYGDKILDVSPEDVRLGFQGLSEKPCIVQRCKRLKKYFPVFYIKIILLLCALMKCIVCKITIPLCMYYRAYKHAKIHRSCEERGIRPVFTGSACHGPLIYGIRKFCCHCRAQRASEDSLKLLEMMNDERKRSGET